MRRIVNRIDKVDPEWEYYWVVVLRQFHRPVHRLRVSKEKTEPIKFGRQDLWKVGRDLLPEKEAIQLARKYLSEERTPRWGVTLKKERNITKQLFRKI